MCGYIVDTQEYLCLHTCTIIYFRQEIEVNLFYEYLRRLWLTLLVNLSSSYMEFKGLN